MRIVLAHLAALAVLDCFVAASHEIGSSQKALSDDFICEHPPYKAHLVSRSPLVLYISDFLTEAERHHVLAATEHAFVSSGVTSSTDASADSSDHTVLRNIRASQSTTLPPTDPVTACIRARALALQGFAATPAQVEPLQLVRYHVGGEYRAHTDWFPASSAPATPRYGGNRASSVFAYVAVANGTRGGGTRFPRLEAPRGEEWCARGWVDCDAPWEDGVVFRPVEGNAVYWENLIGGEAGWDASRGGRMGDERTLHAGLPVIRGEKIGMNIWTREAPLEEI